MWILGTVLGALLFLILLLSVPVDLIFAVERHGEVKGRIRVAWMFGFVGKDIRRRKRKPKKEEKRKRKRGVRPLLAMMRSRGFVRKLSRFIRDVLRRLKIRELKLDLMVGLGDPAETGMLCAAMPGLIAFANSLAPVDMRIRPDFTEAKLRGYLRGDLRVFPIRFVVPTILFSCSPTTLRAIKAMVVARRK